MAYQWQKDQGANCPCRGSDEMCPCQNISPEQRAELKATSPLVLIPEVRDQLAKLSNEICIGPDGEGQDWKNTLEACMEDLETALRRLS